MTDKTDEAVAWILRSDTGTVRLWTQDRGFAEQKAGDWEAATEPLFPASSLASRDARIAELEALLEEGVKGFVADLERRAASCCELKHATKDTRDAHRLMGKEAAYLHAAELARATRTAIRGGK